ncbi:hypothetical protein V2J09_003580 [Rumex salicifolius]
MREFRLPEDAACSVLQAKKGRESRNTVQRKEANAGNCRRYRHNHHHLVIAMVGGGGAIVDGFRRWLHRRSCVAATDLSPADLPVDESASTSAASATPSSLTAQEEFETSFLKPIRVPKRHSNHNRVNFDPQRKDMVEKDFFTEYGEASRYEIQEVVGKGSYGVVASAIDNHTGEMVAIKKINDVFEHISDATRILREIKLLRLLHHPDIVEIKHIMLPPSRREFKDIYVVFELMESDLHQVIKANDDLTPEHHQYFLYQLLRANIFHRDLKPKNILANADCKVKICDFGLARVSFDDAPSAIFWTDYVATRWYRAPELCGSFFSNYTPAIDVWSIGCIFAEMLTGKALFPGKNVVHQLDIMTDLLGTPSLDCITRIRNEKARRYLSSMRKKAPVSFSQKFPNVDPQALRLLERLLAFDPKDRPTAEEALSDPYFSALSQPENEISAQPISKLEFTFERKKLKKEDVRELIYREILEYHPKMLEEYLNGGSQTSFLYPSGVDRFKQQFAHLEEHMGKVQIGSPLQRKQVSMPRERVNRNDTEEIKNGALNGHTTNNHKHNLIKSDSISASRCISVKNHEEVHNNDYIFGDFYYDAAKVEQKKKLSLSPAIEFPQASHYKISSVACSGESTMASKNSNPIISIFFLLVTSFSNSPSAIGAPLFPKEAFPTKSGQLVVNSTSNSSIFYAFYEAQKPISSLSKTPLLIWLQGGPGCSSMTGNFYELGPWGVNSDNKTINLRPNPGAWNHIFGLVFLDNPIGTGFSIASSPDEIPRDQNGVAHHLFVAIKSFIRLNPSFKSRPIYITGESYAGKYVPAIGYYILKKNPHLPKSERINLAGVAIGDGLTDPIEQVKTHASNAYFLGLINEKQKTHLEELQNEAVKMVNSKNWSAATDARNMVLQSLSDMTGLATLYNMRRKTPYQTQLVKMLLSHKEAKLALGTNPSFEWVGCSDIVGAALHSDVMKSVKFMVELLVKESKVLLYQGQLDLRDGVVSVEAWMRKMKWEGIERFLDAERKVWSVNGVLAGYVQKSEALTHVVVLDAGHFVPADQPIHSQAMIQDWVLERGLFA